MGRTRIAVGRRRRRRKEEGATEDVVILSSTCCSVDMKATKTAVPALWLVVD